MSHKNDKSEGEQPAEDFVPTIAFFAMLFALLTVIVSFWASRFIRPVALLSLISALWVYIALLMRQRASADQLGAYRILGKLGEGSMGVVYRAEHQALGRLSALKKIRTDEISSLDLGRFRREAKLLSNLESPHTIEIFDFGQSKDGELFYAMEYLHGKDLQQLVDEHGALSFPRVLHILAQAARSMSEAHALSVVHRDLKPANLMLCVYGGSYDYVKVLDFGLAKGEALSQAVAGLTGEATILGTPAYIAPESFAGSKYVSAAADVYALAAIAHFLLTERLLFEEKLPMKMVKAHMNQVPPTLAERGVQVPAAFDELLSKALAKDPKLRPSMTQFLEDLEKFSRVEAWSNEEARKWWEAQLPDVVEEHARSESK